MFAKILKVSIKQIFSMIFKTLMNVLNRVGENCYRKSHSYLTGYEDTFFHPWSSEWIAGENGLSVMHDRQAY